MDGKPKKSKALIITIVIIILLAVVLFFVYKNQSNLSGVQKTSDTNTNLFESLFGTSKSKNLEVIDTINYGENATTVNAEAGEDIERGDLLYLFGYNSNGDPIVKKITSKITDASDIFAVALENIKKGDVGKVMIPDLSGANSANLWKRIISNLKQTTNNINDWINKILNRDTGTTDTTTKTIKNKPLPTVTITASATVVSSGSSVNISWKSTNTTRCDAGEGRGTGTRGNFDTGPLTSSTSYSIVCKGSNGSAGENILILVDNVAPDFNFPTVAAWTDPSSVVMGGSSTLNWISENATSCMLDDGTTIGLNGPLSIGPVETNTSYTVICYNDNGSSTSSAAIFVDEIPEESEFVTVTVTAEPSFIEMGESSTIKWTSTGADSCYAGEGNSTEINGSFSTGPINKSKSFTVICYNDNGSGSGNATVFVNNPDDLLELPTIDVMASPEFIASGSSSNITWNSINTDSCNTGNGYSEDVTGFFETGPLENNRSYTVSCEGENGSVSGDVFVLIDNNIITESSQCSDGIDNDEDGYVDVGDPSCHDDFDPANIDSYEPNALESTDMYLPECSDGIDNNGYNGIDIEDPGCHYDNDSSNPDSYDQYDPYEGYIEIPFSQCSDGIDNDYDNSIDSEDINCFDTEGNYLAEYDNEAGEPTVPEITQCSDGVDNDLDGTRDENDASCHTNFEAKDLLTYNPNINNEALKKPEGENQCSVLENYRLTFTDKEEAELKELLRKFYIIAPNLKNTDDITLVYNEALKNQELVKEVKNLTNQCYDQTSSPTYNGPTLRYGNPWYRPESRDANSSYLSNDPLNNLQNENCIITKTGGTSYIIENCSEGYKNLLRSEIYDSLVDRFEKEGISEEQTKEIVDNMIGNVLYESEGAIQTGPNQVEIPLYKLFEQVFNIW